MAVWVSGWPGSLPGPRSLCPSSVLPLPSPLPFPCPSCPSDIVPSFLLSILSLSFPSLAFLLTFLCLSPFLSLSCPCHIPCHKPCFYSAIALTLFFPCISLAVSLDLTLPVPYHLPFPLPPFPFPFHCDTSFLLSPSPSPKLPPFPHQLCVFTVFHLSLGH